MDLDEFTIRIVDGTCVLLRMFHHLPPFQDLTTLLSLLDNIPKPSPISLIEHISPVIASQLVTFGKLKVG